MLTTEALHSYLLGEGAAFRLLRQDAPILSVGDAARYYDVEKAAPVYIVETERGLAALIASARRGRLDFAALRACLGFAKLRLAQRKKLVAAGLEPGAVPLLGHGLPCIFDETLLDFDFVYGGTGDAYCTLQIAPRDLRRLSQVVASLPRQAGAFSGGV